LFKINSNTAYSFAKIVTWLLTKETKVMNAEGLPLENEPQSNLPSILTNVKLHCSKWNKHVLYTTWEEKHMIHVNMTMLLWNQGNPYSPTTGVKYVIRCFYIPLNAILTKYQTPVCYGFTVYQRKLSYVM